MPPRSCNDSDENSVHGDCSFDAAACDFKHDLSSSCTSHTSLSSSSDTRSSAKPKKSVTFAGTAKVRQVTKISKEEATDVWFTGDDYSVMKKAFMPTVQRMMNSSLTEADAMSEDFCTRGLEYRTRDGAKQRMKNKFTGMAAVLHEQDRQLFEGYSDDQALARVYQAVNFHCVSEARALGEQDELDIQEYTSTDNEPFYDAKPALPSPHSKSPKRLGKLSASGSFRGIRRMLSGSSKKLLRRGQVQVTTVPVQ